MTQIISILSEKWLNNPIGLWLLAIGMMLFLYSGLVIMRNFFSRSLHRNYRSEGWGTTRALCVAVDSTTKLFFVALSVYIASHILNLPQKQSHILDLLPSLALFLQTGYWVQHLLEYKFESVIESKKTLDEKQHLRTFIVPLKFVILSSVWVLIFVGILDIFGVNVTALVAGLGVGGVAVALAVQSTLADLIAAFAIAFDKPFVVGDFIIIDTLMGTIEKIGIRSTRVRSLGGEELIFQNQDLLKSRIKNYKRMRERRVVFGFGILLQTPYEQLQAIPGAVEKIIRNIEKTRFDRAHFYRFGDSSFDFEVVYYVLHPDYNVYMDIQQAINLALVKYFEQDGISFAYPTRTVYLTRKHPFREEREDREEMALMDSHPYPRHVT